MASLIIITGAPGAGKTTVAKALKQELGWPLIAKDEIKNHFFKEFGYQGRDFNAKLSDISRSLIVYFAGILAGQNHNFIVEGNFAPAEFSPIFKDLAKLYGLDLYQVFCTDDPQAIIERYNNRHNSGGRPDGHDATMDMAAINKYDHPLDLSGDLFTVKAMKFDAGDYAKDRGFKPL